MDNIILHQEDATPTAPSVRLLFPALQSAFNQVEETLTKFNLFPNRQLSDTISFYKNTLPEKLREIFYLSLWLSEIVCSPTEEPEYSRFLSSVQEQYTSYKTREKDMYFYFRCNLTEMDSRLFVLDSATQIKFKPPHILTDTTILLPPATVTYAWFLAYEQLLQHLQDKGVSAERSSPLQWSGTQAGLTELIYSLNEMGVLNGRKNDIKPLKAAFEKAFNFSLGNIYKTYENNRVRKKSRTPFLDGLRNCLIRRMDDDDEHAM